MQIGPGLQAEILRLVSKNSMRGVTAWNRLEQVIGTVRGYGIGRLLAVVAVFSEVPVS